MQVPKGCVALLVLLGVVLVVVAGDEARRVQMEKDLPAQHPASWVRGNRVAPDTRLKLLFALKQQNLKELDRLFWEVSDPQSPGYGKYLTMEQVNALVAPPKQNVNRLVSWLRANGVKSEAISVNPDALDFIEVSVPAVLAERLLGCTFHKYIHLENSKITYVRSSTPYSLPQYIAEIVDFVGGVKHFPKLRKTIVNPTHKREDIVTDPALLRELYSVGDAVGKARNNSQSVVQFLGQFFFSGDLQEFFTLFYQSAIGSEPSIVGPDDGLPGLEASLDIEYIMTLGANVPTTFWSNQQTPDENNEPFLYFLRDVAATRVSPLVFSISYGDDGEPSQDYALRVSAEFQKQGLRGISFLFASGDSGVGGDNYGDCTAFVPDYPATSPYVTAVGGTALPLVSGGEYANGLSGGGFSNVYTRPRYQEQAVNNYLKNNKNTLPDTSKWNSTGRAYPDVAAMSSNFVIVINLIPTPGVAGTSCAAPTFSGIIALLNDLRLSAGKPQLGFLNPFIYQNPGLFNDITTGSNPGCGTEGFQAAPGWDPATGYGTPNYAKLAQAVMALP